MRASPHPRMTKQDNLGALSPLLRPSADCAELRFEEEMDQQQGSIPLHEIPRQQVVLSLQHPAAKRDFPNLLKQGCKCVVGFAGSSGLRNGTALNAVAHMLMLVRRHVIVLERGEVPSEEELRLLKRPLVWVERTGRNVIVHK